MKNKYIYFYIIDTCALYDRFLHKSVIENNIKEVKYILNFEKYCCDNNLC